MEEKMPYIPSIDGADVVAIDGSVEDIDLSMEATMLVENDFYSEFAEIAEIVCLSTVGKFSAGGAANSGIVLGGGGGISVGGTSGLKA